MGVGKCYGPPLTATESRQNAYFCVPPDVGGEAIREPFYTDGIKGMKACGKCVCVCARARAHALVCVCLCVCINAQTRKKPAIPFANIDMGVPAQSCYKDYCLLRSHFIKLKHTPPAARRCRCRRFRHFLPLAGVFGSRGETLGSSLAEDRRTQGCPVVIQSLLEAENAAVSPAFKDSKY